MANRTAKAPPAAEEPAEPVLNANGEMLLPLDARYVLRPSRRAIQAIERQLRPLLELAQDAARGALSIDEMAVISAEMMRAYGAANPNEPGIVNYTGAQTEPLADLIFEAGSSKICARLMVVLTGALSGGYNASGEAKPATETKTS